MGLNDFELIGNFKVKCKTCGKVLPTGLISVSSHWVECTGKEFTKALIKERGKGSPLNTMIIDDLKKRHLI